MALLCYSKCPGKYFIRRVCKHMRTTNKDYQGSAIHDNFCNIGYFCTVGHAWSATGLATYAQRD